MVILEIGIDREYLTIAETGLESSKPREEERITRETFLPLPNCAQTFLSHKAYESKESKSYAP